MKLTQIDSWKPKGVDDLEKNAWNALKCTGNKLITAGPGAGKTELLAQNVCFLLETKLCPAPRKILAISFKKDAAENLAERITDRVSMRMVDRFESMTFDAFTKGIVERFQLCLPAEWQLPTDFEIGQIDDNQYKRFLDLIGRSNPSLRATINSMTLSNFKNRHLATYRISTDVPAIGVECLAHMWLKERIKKGADFLVLNRLAEFILRTNLRLRRALALTYAVVIVDEFQDTTHAQYDFLESVTGHMTGAQIIAVGDIKQRIMGWAGAKHDCFEKFVANFDATTFELETNYRSSPELVRIHQILARSIDPKCSLATSAVGSKIKSDVAEIWNFKTATRECSYVADWISSDMKTRGLAPVDYAILVRQKPEETYDLLAKALSTHKLYLSNQAQRVGKLALQDILSDRFFIFVSALLRIVIQQPAADAWLIVTDTLGFLFPTDEHGDIVPRYRKFLEKLIEKQLRPLFIDYVDSRKSINRFLQCVLTSFDEHAIRATFPQLSATNSYTILIEALEEHLNNCATACGDWHSFIDAVDQSDRIPLLTIHKSKGLEYDTVIFMSLDDSSWWSYSKENLEGQSTFFVGLSRAKQRVVFTHVTSKGRARISDIYKLLKSAGVLEKLIT